MEVDNRFICIKAAIDGFPQESDFEIKTETLCFPTGVGNKQVLVKSLYVSIDPYQLNRMKSHSSSQAATNVFSPKPPGEVIETVGLGRVIESKNPEFQRGDLVVGLMNWAEYTIVKEGAILTKLDPMGLPLPHYLGALGFAGLTAYAGFFEVCKPKKGETVFVSAASGSVGSLVGQFAKISGCYVVGCAGTQKKVDLLKEELGFDDAFNYKEEIDLNAALKRYFPNGIDIYFDNVGGKMLEAAIANMNPFGRVAICGVISEYTNDSKRAAPNMLDVLYHRITMQGFLVGDFMKLYEDFLSTTIEHFRAGKIKSLIDISSGLETIPSAFVGLFRGDNIGKKIVKIADE